MPFLLEKTQTCTHTPTLSAQFKLHFLDKKLYFISNRSMTLPYLFISFNLFKLKMLPENAFLSSFAAAIYGGPQGRVGNIVYH